MSPLGVLAGRRVVALTGAGCSTDSGIPDYRSPGSRPRNPVRYQPFVQDAAIRQRYWARSCAGWPAFAAARPNAGHRALAEAEARGWVVGVLTQNVDGLHQGAGSRRVIELHGSLGRVKCLRCGQLEARELVQERMLLHNPGHATGRAGDEELAPDGDAELRVTDGFRVPACLRCGGVLKPDVVFFGENVPAPTVEAAWALLGAGDALLVLGTSLTVWSGYRFVRRAAEAGLPVVIVNDGPTRGDPLATVRVDGRVGAVLAGWVG